MTLDTLCGTVVWPNGADFAPEALRELEAEETCGPSPGFCGFEPAELKLGMPSTQDPKGVTRGIFLCELVAAGVKE